MSIYDKDTAEAILLTDEVSENEDFMTEEYFETEYGVPSY